MTSPSRLLIRSVNWLGDAIMSTPAVMSIRRAYPSAEISILTPQKLAGLWAHHPGIDKVVTFADGESVSTIGKRLRAEVFELAIIFPNSFKTALEPFLAGIPRRIGYGGQWRSMLLTERVARIHGAQSMRKRSRAEIVRLNEGVQNPGLRYTIEGHHVRSYLSLAAAAGGSDTVTAPVLRVAEDEIGEFCNQFKVRRGGGRRIIGLNPGAEYGPAKRWPADRYVEAAAQISKQAPCDWLIFGGKGETDSAAEIARRMRGDSALAESEVHVLAGRTSLRQLCVGLKLCNVLLTNDTGPMHVAAALGTPVVVPFGSTSPELTGPDPEARGMHRILRADVPCSPCFLRECPIDFRCMIRIEPGAVATAALQALAEQPIVQ